MDLFTPDVVKAFVTNGTGAALGTLIKTLNSPEPDLRKWVVKASASWLVGTLFGLSIGEYMQLGFFMGIAAASLGALLSEQIIAFFMARGELLKKGDINLGLKEDDDAK